MTPKIAVIYYSTWGHIAKMAESVIAGIKEAGGSADVYQVKETLPQATLTQLFARPQDQSIPFITPEKLAEYDGFMMGIPTRFGNFPAQWKTFWDSCGGLWMTGALHGKYCGMFISTASLGGGQESTAIATMSTLAHQGVIYVPFGYPPGQAFGLLGSLAEVHGGSPWGAGTFAGSDGSRMPTETELELATI